jgi:hypothetical protein
MRAPSPSSARPSRTAAPTLADPRHAAWLAALTYAVATMLLAWPALGGGFLVNPHSDQYIGGFPVRDFAGQSLKAGQGIPQWNPYLFGGLPYVAAMHGDIFYPTALLRLLLPTDVGLTWGFIIHLFLAGCFTYGFLRAWGLAFFPALLGGLAYMLSGQIASLVSPGHDGKLFVSALLPLALWMLVRGVRDGRHWAWGVLAVTIGLAVLSPHPQLLQYLLLTSGAFALYLALATRPDGTKLTRREGVTRLAFALGAVVIGGAIGAVQYLPVVEYVPFSPRAGGRGYEYATSYSMPIEELINTYLPQFSGMFRRGSLTNPYWGRNGIHLHSEYLGASALILAGAAFGGDARRSFRRFWLVAGVVALLWALGGYTPFYHLVYALVPGSKFFRAPSTIFYVVSFAVAVLAALGAERLVSGELRRGYLLGWLAAGVAIALLAAAGFFTTLGQSLVAGFGEPGVDQLQDLVERNRTAVIVGAWRSLLFVGATVGVLWLGASGRLAATATAWLLAAVIALDLWSVERSYWLFSPPASVVYATDPAIQYLQKAETGRVLAEAVSAEGLADADPYFGGDGLMVHRIRMTRGYHGNEIGRYQRLASRQQPGDYGNLVNPAFWRLTNTRYLYTNGELSDSGVTKLVGPVRNSAGSTVYLYRLPGDNPPPWIAPAMAKAGDEATQGTILDPRYEPLRVAVIDSAASVDVPPLKALPEPLGITPKVTRYDPGHIALEWSPAAPAGSALVVSENYFPGWTATVNGGQGAPVVRTDFTFIGVPLPAGATSVRLDFHDAAYQRGKVVSILAGLIALALVAAGTLMERRRRVA